MVCEKAGEKWTQNFARASWIIPRREEKKDACPVGWSKFFVVDLAEDCTKPKVRNDFRSKNPIFRQGALGGNVLIFKKFQGV